MHTRRILLILPFVVPFVLHALYQPINAAWTVDRFGCGCPPLKGGGGAGFNANHFNAILWFGIAVACAAAWWCLLRPEFKDRRSTRYMFTQSMGVTFVFYICVRRFAAEVWL